MSRDPKNKSLLVEKALNAWQWLGFGALVLFGAGIPLFVPINSFLQANDIDTDRSEYMVVKLVAYYFVAGAVLLLGAGALLTPLWRRYRGPVLLPAAGILGFLAWSGFSVLASPNTAYSFYYWLPVLLGWGAALCGPFFFAEARRVKWFLITMLGVGMVISFIGVASSLGYDGFFQFIYGTTPEQMIAEGRFLQGGTARAASQSTLANAEYAGSFAGIVAAIAAVMLFDWVPRWGRYRMAGRILVLGLLGIVLLELVFSGSRQPWIALFLAGLLRLLLALGIRVLPIAAGFCAFLLSVLFGGFMAGIVVALLLFAGLFVYTIWNGRLLALAKKADRFNTGLVVGGPILLAVVLIGFSVPGPWNPTGLRILQRFASITSPEDESVLERSIMFMTASQITWTDPVFGAGPGRYTNRMYPALGELVEKDESGVMFLSRVHFAGRIADQAHNDYLQIAAETGLGGLVFFLTTMVFLLGELLRLARGTPGPTQLAAMTLMITLITFLAVMLTSFPLQMPSRSAFFYTTVAASLGLIAAAREQRGEAAGEAGRED